MGPSQSRLAMQKRPLSSTTRTHAQRTRRFRVPCVQPCKNNVAIIGHSAHQQWWNIKTAQTGLDRYSDVYKALASYCQNELGLYKESGYDLKFAKVETLKDRKEEQTKHSEDRRKNLTETEEWAKNLYSNYT